MTKSLLILIADGSKYISQILQARLRKVGCDALTVDSAKDLLALATRMKPDALVLDLQLPGADGFALCRALKKNAATRDIHIFIHAHCKGKSDILRALDAGASSFIVKPASVETILQKIRLELTKVAKHKQEAEEHAPPAEAGALQFDAAQPPEQKIKALLDHTHTLHGLPYTLARVMKITDDSEAGARELARVIESDTSITAMVLRRANSAQYGGKQSVVEARDAIVRMGFTETRSLVLAMQVVRLFDEVDRSLGFNRLDFWEHSFAAGNFASMLAAHSGVCNPGRAFIAGLLHDIGKIVFDEFIPEQYETAIEAAYARGIALHAAELECLGVTHNQVGAALLEQWSFEPAICKAALLHNSAPGADAALAPDERALVEIAAAANRLAKAFCHGSAGDQMIEPIPRELALRLQLGEGLDPAFSARVAREIEEARSFLLIPPRKAHTTPDYTQRQILLWEADTPPVSTLHLYLASNLLTVKSFRELPALVAAANADPARRLALLHTAGGVDARALVKQLAGLDASVPVLFAGETREVSDWMRQGAPFPTDVLAAPLSGSELLKKVTNLCADLD